MNRLNGMLPWLQVKAYCIYNLTGPAALSIHGTMLTTYLPNNFIQNIATAFQVQAYVKSIHSLTICSL